MTRFKFAAIGALIAAPLFAQNLQITGQVQQYTVATLPAAAANNGTVLWVTDANSTTVGGTCTTGGTDFVPCKSDGSTWKIIAAGAASGGGSSLTVAAPYLVDSSGNKFVAATGAPVTVPDLTGWTYLDANTTTNTTGPNGNVTLTNSGTVYSWMSTTAATNSIEAVFSSNETGTGGLNAQFSDGVWLYDSTNHFIYALLEFLDYGGTPAASLTVSPRLAVGKSASYTTGTPSISTYPLVIRGNSQAPYHLKLSVSGGTLTASYSLDGGSTFTTAYTVAVGTISKGGLFINNKSLINVFSLKVQ